MRKHPKPGTLLALWKPRYVQHVGYDTNFSSILRKTLYEASPVYTEQHYPQKPGHPPPRLTAEIVQAIIENHPIFQAYCTGGRAACSAWLGAAELGYTKHSWQRLSLRNAATASLDREMVRAFVSGIVQHALRNGDRKRKIQFGELAGEATAPGIMNDSWRGPWQLKRVLRRVTGTYAPSSGCDDFFEPAGLVDVRHHTLYEVVISMDDAYYTGAWYRNRPLIVAPEDTVPWDEFGNHKKTTEEMAEGNV